MPLALFPDLTWQVMENSKYHFIEEVKKQVIERSEPGVDSTDAHRRDEPPACYPAHKANPGKSVAWFFKGRTGIRIQSQCV